MERQKPFNLCFLTDTVFNIGINYKNLFRPVFIEQIEKNLTDFPCTLHGRVLGGIKKASLNRNFMMIKILSAVLSDNKKLGVGVLGKHFFRFADDILVIHPGKTLICGDNQACIRAAEFGHTVFRIKIAVIHIFYRSENPLDFALYSLKIRACFIEVAFDLAHFH